MSSLHSDNRLLKVSY